ncbi:MAG TPA: hypothetical protein VM901_03815 [Bdellovibrionota bacterium]|nr:hypothetical protein [Bdellovibrionota bacterium]
MNLRPLILSISLCATATLAGNIRISFDPSLPEKCKSLVYQALEPHVGAGNVHATTYGQLIKTLVDAGHPLMSATVDAFFTKIKRDSPSDKLRRLFATLDTESRDQLAFCLADQKCKFGRGFRALHQHLSPQFRTRISERQGRLASHTKVYSLRPVPEVSDIILLKLPANRPELSEWLLSFIEETSHYSDFRTLDRWVEINRKRSQNGEATDALFQRFAEFQNDTIYLPEGFVRLFLESSATENTADLFQAMGHPSGEDHFGSHARGLLQNVAGMNEESRNFVSDNGITPETLYATYRQWYREINASISNVTP